MAIQEPPPQRLTSRRGFWEPANEGGASFGTHRLKKVGEQRLVFAPTVANLASRTFFLVVGVGIALVGPLVKLKLLPNSGETGWGGVLFVMLSGGLCAGFGGFLLRSALRRPVFDKTAGTYWRGKERPSFESSPGREGGRIRLADVVALQLLAERVRSRSSRFTSYELNLVLANGERVNVVDHARKSALEADARTLSRFLGVTLLSGEGRAEAEGGDV